MVFNRRLKLLCPVTRSHTRQCDQVILCYDFANDFFNIYLLIGLAFNFSAQQAFETLKLTFGDNKCFLVQINSQQTPSTNDIIDPWLKYLRRQPKMVSFVLHTHTL